MQRDLQIQIFDFFLDFPDIVQYSHYCAIMSNFYTLQNIWAIEVNLKNLNSWDYCNFEELIPF